MKKIIKRFSLIEMIVVIGIIAVLIAITMPVFTSIREKAKKTKAKAEMNAIETAVKSYEMTYGVLPIPSGWANGNTGVAYNELMAYLTNVQVSPGVGTTGNGRGIRFLDVPENYTSAALEKNSFRDPYFCDPEDPNKNKYRIYLDTNYDGVVVTGLQPDPCYGTVFIYSCGPDLKDDGGSKKDDVCSWQ